MQHVEMGMAFIAVIKDSRDEAQEYYDLLKGYSGTILYEVQIDRLLGLLAHTMGNPDDAAAHFEDALAFCRKAGYRPELAWTCCDYADTLRAEC